MHNPDWDMPPGSFCRTTIITRAMYLCVCLGYVPCFLPQRLIVQLQICNRGSAQACPSKVLEDDVDFLQTQPGLEALSLDMTAVDQWGFDFEVKRADSVTRSH